jgi:hypothetical protein
MAAAKRLGSQRLPVSCTPPDNIWRTLLSIAFTSSMICCALPSWQVWPAPPLVKCKCCCRCTNTLLLLDFTAQQVNATQLCGQCSAY